MSTERILIVGACQAGVQVAATLRDGGHIGDITLAGAEPFAPYQRPPLSKTFIKGEGSVGALALRDETYWKANRLDLRRGTRVTQLDLDAGKAVTSSGVVLDFDRVALTTGARVRRLTIPGSELSNVFYIRDLVDAGFLTAALRQARSVVVIGGGFIGLEAAAVARSMGKAVTVIESLPRLIMRAVAPVVSSFYADAHRRRGTTVLLEQSVVELFGVDGSVREVRLADGTVVQADLVVVGIGVVPRTELAEQAGISVQGGIVVDEYARASDHRVVAAGDCTVGPSPTDPSKTVRLESVQNAIDQAKVAAATLLGRCEPYRSVPWFWSDQADLKLQIAGLSSGWDQMVLRGSTAEERFAALYFREGRLIAADCVNCAGDYMVVRRALSAGATIAPDLAADASVPLKSLVSGGRPKLVKAQPVHGVG